MVRGGEAVIGVGIVSDGEVAIGVVTGVGIVVVVEVAIGVVTGAGIVVGGEVTIGVVIGVGTVGGVKVATGAGTVGGGEVATRAATGAATRAAIGAGIVGGGEVATGVAKRAEMEAAVLLLVKIITRMEGITKLTMVMKAGQVLMIQVLSIQVMQWWKVINRRSLPLQKLRMPRHPCKWTQCLMPPPSVWMAVMTPPTTALPMHRQSRVDSVCWRICGN